MLGPVRCVVLLGVVTLAASCGAEEKPSSAAKTDAGASESADPTNHPTETDKPSDRGTNQQDPTATAGSQVSMSMLVDSVAALPACDSTRQGSLAYVRSEAKFYACDATSWSMIDIKGPKGDKGDKGDQGTKGDAGAAGVAITSNKLITASATDFCTQFSGESCYFNGGQIIKMSDGTVLVTAGWTYGYVAPGSSDYDSDTDYSPITILVPPATAASQQKLHAFVARGFGYRAVYLVYTRASDKLEVIYDTDDDLLAESTDTVLLTATTQNW